MHRGVPSRPPNEIPKQKERRRERERGECSVAQGLLVFGFGESVGGKTGAVTLELLFAEWGNQWEGRDDLAVTWKINMVLS